MFCTSCGSNIKDGSAFCPYCGATQRPKAGGLTERIDPSGPKDEPRPTVVDPAPAPLPERLTEVDPTPPAPSTPTDWSTPPAPSAPPKRRNPVPLIAAGIAAAVALGCIGVFGVYPLVTGHALFGGGASNEQPADNPSSSRTGRTVTISLNGKKVTSIQRPSLVFIDDANSGLGATPGLAAYISQGSGAQGGSSSGSGSSSSKGSSTGTSSQGSNSAAKPASGTVKQEDGKTTLSNALGTLEPYSTDAKLSNVINADMFTGYTRQYPNFQKLLSQNLFAVMPRQGGYEFFDTYEINRYNYIPNFVTVDSMMHTYHLYFAHMLKQCEEGTFSDKLISMSKTMLSASIEQYNQLAGTEWEDASRRNVIYFGVATLLLGEDAAVPEELAATIQDEAKRVEAGSGQSACAVTGDAEDYSQYKPRGYYTEDVKLERYFRVMMWYGRINFTREDALGDKGDELDRSALLMTIAMDDGSHGTPLADWSSVYTVTSFFAGASDDCGYYEYYPLFQAAYGEKATVEDLPGNEDAWKEYHEMTGLMSAPRISSVIVHDEEAVTDDDIKGFRFMGQRFTLDESIFQQLVHDNVNKRTMPTALDVPAALGSDEALSIIESEGLGESTYKGYDAQMKSLREDLANAGGQVWGGSLYSQWLYTINPLLVEKGEGYPSFMQSQAWTRKNLQTYLGSYTELKHDTVLYTKQIMVEMGGGPIDKPDDRGYVEAEPEVFERLANLVASMRDGLSGYGMLPSADKANLDKLESLSLQLATIARKELAGKLPTDEEFDLIRSYGGQLEHFWAEVYPNEHRSINKPAAVVVDVATDNDNHKVLELGTGNVDDIYVIVPVEGKLRIAVGTVYSYYEFEQPQNERLTDEEWRESLGLGKNGNMSNSATSALSDVASWTKSFKASQK